MSRSTRKFGSLNYHQSQQRTAIDDLQSLVFSIWDVAGCESNEPYGTVILESIKTGKLRSEVKVSRNEIFEGIINKIKLEQYLNILDKMCTF